ncbi:transcriptional regulator, MarR family [Syntrophobotulus glycolicus DSM 8271]|uniref:Transcriptional regulator, MarR family n=1 Tax=Syntrophobotulus glycolicus (strain DSM 8271 / FlGlyR) TaxID=645991 RepID=F0T0D5_SYNGF|nr:MarR family winged helix-turn-helix transcriptional regulator [Syntrophobotulus glycolicus]ADY57307.1 transcriptional regulator, MarR family [Syntrophobotulus glycolicus DSM 8271]
MEQTANLVLSEFLLKTFNDILAVEEYEIKKGPFSNLSISEIHTIAAMGMYKPRTMSEVAADLNVTVGTLTAAINNLVKKGCVERKRDEDDRRVVKIQLTKKGKLAYRIHEKFHLEMVKETTKGLPDRENILLDSLRKLYDHFIKTYK